MAKIRVVAPARWIDKDISHKFTYLVEKFGHSVEYSDQCFYRNTLFAGSDEVRFQALANAIDDPCVDVIWCAGGGYGSGRLLSALKQKKSPRRKLLIGYSDITYLLSICPQLGLIPIHGAMPIDLEIPNKAHLIQNTISSINEFLENNHTRIINGICVQTGCATGPIVGGNLSVLNNLIGTPYSPNFKSAILLLEDVSEYKYALDRMLFHLEHAGVFDEISGVCLGSFENTKEGRVAWGSEVSDMLQFHLKGKPLPIASMMPIGHGSHNEPVELFRNMTLRVSELGASLCQISDLEIRRPR